VAEQRGAAAPIWTTVGDSSSHACQRRKQVNPAASRCRCSPAASGALQNAKSRRKKREFPRTTAAFRSLAGNFAVGRARNRAAKCRTKNPQNRREKRLSKPAAPSGRAGFGEPGFAKSSLVWRNNAKSFEELAPTFGKTAPEHAKSCFTRDTTKFAGERREMPAIHGASEASEPHLWGFAAKRS
jgi:hypothetical protein